MALALRLELRAEFRYNEIWGIFHQAEVTDVFSSMGLVAGWFPCLAFCLGFAFYFRKRMVWTPTLLVAAGSAWFLWAYSVAYQAYVMLYFFLCWFGCWAASAARRWADGRRAGRRSDMP